MFSDKLNIVRVLVSKYIGGVPSNGEAGCWIFYFVL